MKHLRFLLAAAAWAAGASLPLSAAEPARPVPPRFSVGYMDASVDPRADFARYAFGAWQKANPVPPDKARWGSFNELEQYNQLALKGILEGAAARAHQPGSIEQKVGDFFKSAMDTAAVDAAGLKPVEADLARVAAIGSTPELARALAALHDRGVEGFFRVFVRADQKKSEINALYAYQGGMSLPSKAYYFDEQFEKFRVAFVEHVAKMLVLAGDAPETAAAGAKTVFDLEKALAADAKTPAELRDALANYNRMPTADLAGKVPGFPLARYLADRLSKLDWMTEPTGGKALAKFERFVAKIGYPAKWRDYLSVAIRPDAFLANVRAATEFEVRRRLSQLGKPVDKAEWRMTPPTVNAYFDPTANNINFPAGILQPPFFDFSLDDAVNYGGIGAVIGHEITHGLDDQGRHYDPQGNLADWWTPEDAAQFQARAKKVVEQFSGYEPLPGVKVNGELTLGENIADLGGASLAYEALQRSLASKEKKLIDGFTPEQRFFLSWAQVWRTNMRENALRQQLAVDPHSPGMIRAIGPLVNLQPFYDAFGIREGDPMWRRPEDRAKIW